ncbi:MAG: hypothetical protein EZS28_033864, partial [Streblomastix strix]
MKVKREDVDRYKADVNQHIVGKPTCCIQAIDESGCNDWPEAKPQKMLVSENITVAQLNYEVKRNGHLYIVMRAITLCVHATDISDGEDVGMVPDPKGQVKGSIMRNWVTDQAISYVDSLRPEQLKMQDEAIFTHQQPMCIQNRRGGRPPKFFCSEGSFKEGKLLVTCGHIRDN